MRVQFCPQTNFLRNFPVYKRPVWINDKGPKSRKLARYLAQHYRIPVSGEKCGHANCSFCICSLNDLPGDWQHIIDKRYSNICPQHAITLLPHPRRPVVWIGGQTVQAVEQTADFLLKVIDYLVTGYLTAVDFHIHTTASDGFATAGNVVLFACRSGIDAIAVSDHYSIKGAQAVRKSLGRSFPVIIAQETSDSKGNHVLLFNDGRSLKHLSPQQVIKLWSAGKIKIVSPHTTESDYLFRDKNRAIGIEIFNFISRAPYRARQFVDKMLKCRLPIPVLGNSDAHLAEDIGSARTYIFCNNMTPKEIFANMMNGRTVACFQGQLVGESKLEKVIRKLSDCSNLLEGKLVPLERTFLFEPPSNKEETWSFGKEYVQRIFLPFASGLCKVQTDSKAVVLVDSDPVIFTCSQQATGFAADSKASATLKLITRNKSKTKLYVYSPTGDWQPLRRRLSRSRSVFCDWPECDCDDHVFLLPPEARHCLLRTGIHWQDVLDINGDKEKIRLYPGLEMSLSNRLSKGKNKIELSGKMQSGSKGLFPRIFSGHELTDWELCVPGQKWKPVEKSSNLQVLDEVPKNFEGVVLYRTRISPVYYPKSSPTLYGNGFDGHITLFLDGQKLLVRGNAHWEDDFFLSLPEIKSRKSLTLTVELVNIRAFCGITAPVYIGSEVALDRPRVIEFDTSRTDIVLLRVGETRVRGFLTGRKVTRPLEVLAGSRYEPVYLQAEHNFEKLILNAFDAPSTFYRPCWQALSKRPFRILSGAPCRNRRGK